MNTISNINVRLPVGEVINAFHVLYYYSLQWDQNRYLGYQIKQCPMDLHLYQELVFETKPRFILQTGVAGGGSILYFANLLDLCGAPPDNLVVGIDVELTNEARSLKHPRIRLIEGSSISSDVLSQVDALLPPGNQGMVVLDADHAASHVMQEIRMYKERIGLGCYLVVEDTNINGHPVLPEFGPGPLEAVNAFLEEDQRFVSDDRWKRTLFSFHHQGWLLRVQ